MTPSAIVVKRQLKRLGLCPKCPFTLLSEEIKLGQEYLTVAGVPSRTFRVLCGGCGNFFESGPTVLAFSVLYPEDAPRAMPLAMFQEIDSSVESIPVP